MPKGRAAESALVDWGMVIVHGARVPPLPADVLRTGELGTCSERHAAQIGSVRSISQASAAPLTRGASVARTLAW